MGMIQWKHDTFKSQSITTSQWMWKCLWLATDSFVFQSIKAKMEELRPLIPVLEAYKADTLLVKQFREEVANVTELLGTLQEQLGGLDYQDLHSRVMSLEDRLRACMQRLGESSADNSLSTSLTALVLEEAAAWSHIHTRDENISQYIWSCLFVPACGKLKGISEPITIKTSGSRFGSWMTDPLAPPGDERVSQCNKTQAATKEKTCKVKQWNGLIIHCRSVPVASSRVM